MSFVYFEKEPRRRFRRELLTRDEPQRIAAIFAKLPELLGAGGAEEPFIRSRLHLYAKGYAWVSSRSNIAEANVTPCPSMFLLDAFPF